VSAPAPARPGLRRALALLRAIEPPRRLFALAGAGLLVQTALGLVAPWPMKMLVDDVLAPAARGAPPSRGLALVLALAGGVALGAALARSVHARAKTALGLATVVRLRNHLFAHLQRLSLAFHDRQRTGELANRLGANTYALWTLTDALAFAPAGALVTLAGAAFLMARLDWRLALVALATAPALFLAIRRYADRSWRVAREFHDREGELAARTEESLQAVRVVQAFAREEEERRRYEALSGSIVEARLRMIDLDNRFGVVCDLVLAAGTVAIMGIGADAVRSGRLTIGELLVFVAYLGMLYGPLSTLSYLAGTVSGALASLGRVVEVLDEVPEVRDREGAAPLPRPRGEVELRAATFRYGRGEGGVAGATLRARPGEVTAITGPTGAGKSTLLSLIPRFYDVSEGAVLVDGRDVREVRLADLRRAVAIVLQESFLFDASIRENIAFGRPGASDAEVEAAARAAQALDFIRALPEGFETRAGGRGVRLSGGERQRIAIARAFLVDAPILLLDEPTSALDERTEAALLESLRALMRGRTTFVVTHRPALAREADRVLRVEAGRVVEVPRRSAGGPAAPEGTGAGAPRPESAPLLGAAP
jgi:ABC-type multidrug transport system fused ATPase/permease subunit